MKTQHNKLLGITLMLLALGGCASHSVSPEATQTLKQTQGYNVGKIDVKLVNKSFLDFTQENKLYPNTQQLASYFKHDIEKYLKQNGKACQNKQNCLTIDMNIAYARNFNFKSVTVSAPTIDRTIHIRKGDTVIYTDSKSDLKPHSGGLLGNAMNELSVLTKAGKNTPNLQDERKDIDVISKMTVQEIVGL